MTWRRALRGSVLCFSATLSRCKIILLLIAAPSLLLVVLKVRVHVCCDRPCAVLMREGM